MDKLIGESIKQFYDFLTCCLGVLWLSFADPTSLMGKVFPRQKDNNSSETLAGPNGETRTAGDAADHTQSAELPDAFSYLILLSLLSSMLTQYMVLLLQTAHIQSFITIMDSITFSRIIAYTLLPFLFVYVFSRLILWVLRKISSVLTTRISAELLSDDQIFMIV